MAQMTIQIPDDKVALVQDSFDSAYPGRTGTKAAWAKQQVIQFIRSVVRREEFRTAEAAIPPPTDIDLT